MKFLIVAALITAVVANDIIDGEWMVKIKLDVDQDALSRLLKHSFAVDVQKFINFPTLALMHVKAKEADITRARQLSEILLVEPNQLFYTTQDCSAVSSPGVWGIDRIDQTGGLGYSLPTDPSAVYSWHANSDGSGTTAHIVDTGILDSHADFGGRATQAQSYLPSEVDDNGHGTHCAGTIGSNSYGVAKGVSLFGCKCLNALGSGSTADVISCIDWSSNIAQNADTMNLSLGGGASSTMDDAVTAAVNAGTTVVCAAGNSDADACNSSPGRAPACITVGATEVDDQTASYTNYGNCLDIWAPGTDILSTWNDGGTNRISGTSMACPHVVGAANRYIETNPGASPADVVNYLTGAATPNVINFRAGHSGPDALLYYACSA